MGLGFGGLGFGVWGMGPTPKPPIPNPQSPIPIRFLIKKIIFIIPIKNIIKKYKNSYQLKNK
jgi:hypothetical protein